MLNTRMMNAMRNFGMEITREAIELCSSKYNFDAEEAMRYLLDDVGFEKPKKSRKSEKSGKSGKSGKSQKSSIVLPFNGECDMSKCHALRQNSGLYTQCNSEQTIGVFCNNCHKNRKPVFLKTVSYRHEWKPTKTRRSMWIRRVVSQSRTQR